MWDNVLSILLGFVLTTVIWWSIRECSPTAIVAIPNAARLREEERQKASDVCQRISSLVDKRLYRMQRLLWAIVGRANGRMTAEAVDDRLHEYDEVVYEWNDELNARLAVVGAYFGKGCSGFLDRVVYEAFMEAGQRIEDLYCQVTATDSAVRVDDHAVSRTNTDIGRLNHLAYQLGVTMMVRVREERVGRAAPGALGESSLTATRL